MRQSPNDKVVLVGAGVTLFECLKAQEQLAAEGINVAVVDIFSVQPIDHELLVQQAQRVGGRVITVEDHYRAGGIGEAVSSTLSDLTNVRVRSLYIKELPRSGTPDELLEHYGISAKHIVSAVKAFQ